MSVSPEMLTLRNFEVGVDDVYDIGRTADGSVIDEIGLAFDVPTKDLGAMVGAIAPHKELQKNIEFAHTRLSDLRVLAELGQSGKTPYEVAADWCGRAALQARVMRPLMRPADASDVPFDVALVTDGVVNWMDRMATVAMEASDDHAITHALFEHNSRLIAASENEYVAGNTPVGQYLADTLVPMLEEGGKFATVDLSGIEGGNGDAVMAAAAEFISNYSDVSLKTGRILVAAVAGNWPQKGAQARQALRRIEPTFDGDPKNPQLWVASDEFPLGITGQEPKISHQNPLSAIGNILRSAKLFSEIQE